MSKLKMRMLSWIAPASQKKFTNLIKSDRITASLKKYFSIN